MIHHFKWFILKSTSLFCRNCYYRKKTCTRCKRIEKKETESVTMEGMELKTVDLLRSKESVDSGSKADRLEVENKQISNGEQREDSEQEKDNNLNKLKADDSSTVEIDKILNQSNKIIIKLTDEDSNAINEEITETDKPTDQVKEVRDEAKEDAN